MPIITVTKSMLKRGEPLEEGWYKAKLKAYSREANKNKNGMNCIPVFEVADKSDPDNLKEVRMWYPESNIGKDYLAFYGSILDKMDEIKFDGTDEVDTMEPKEVIGSTCWIHLIQEIYAGRINNKIDNYLPPGEDPAVFGVF